MAISLSSLKSTISDNPPVLVVYGVDGVGKTTLASEFPDPIYLPTEGERAPSGVDMPTPGTIESLNDLFDIFAELLTQDHDRKTVIIDSLDGLESLIWKATCARLGIASIEAADFGKGYVEADTEWSEYLSAISELARNGIAVVQIAHPSIIRFDSPTTEPYSRYTTKMHKRANSMVRERCDIVAFMDYRISLKEKEVAPKTKITHAVGGRERQIHLAERAGFQAKNRYDMPDMIKYTSGNGYAELSKFFPAPKGKLTAASNDNASQEHAA